MTTPLRNKALGGMLTPIFDEAEWMLEAACRPHGPDLWFSRSEPDIVHALAICETCPVADECLRHSRKHHVTDGVWGGYTALERTRLRNNKPPIAHCRCGNRIIDVDRWGKGKSRCRTCIANKEADRKAKQGSTR